MTSNFKLFDSGWDNVREVEEGSLEEIFEEEPVDLKTFIQDKKFLGESWYLSPIQEDAVRHIERIYMPDLYPRLAEAFDSEYWAKDLPVKNLITLQYGKGAGKDFIARVSSLRIAYLLMCMRSPQKYFGMPEDDSIHMLNVATTGPQAKTAFFDPLRRAVRRGWFADRSQPLNNSIQYAKNIMAISGNSEAESQEGLNLILGVADEIDAFQASKFSINMVGRDSDTGNPNADSILKMLEGSASTRFPDVFKRVVISYPRFRDSPIQKLTTQAKLDIELYGEDSQHYVSGPYATWEVNPTKKRSDFDKKYRSDPIEAAAMFECKPPLATNAYFRNMPALRQSVVREDQPITVEYVQKRLKDSEGQPVTVWDAEFHIADWFQPKEGVRYAMHADLAITGDRAGVAMSHVKKWIDRTVEDFDDDTGDVTETVTRVPVVANDFTISFTADKKSTPPREIQIAWARRLAFTLIARGFLITYFTFDQFQSADSMQILERRSIETKRVSADISEVPYRTLRDLAYTGRLELPYDERLFNELGRLAHDGRKVDHPVGGSKDMSDALACSLVGAIEIMGEETVDGKEVDISDNLILIGEAMQPLSGMGTTDMSNLLPVGMKGMSLYG